jgi:hypothetical protein
LGSPAWPDQAGWQALRAADQLDEAGPSADLDAAGGTVELTLEPPNPGVALVTLSRTG